MRNSIIFYRSFYEAIRDLDTEVQASVYTAIFEYSLNFNEMVLSGLPKAIFTLIKPQLDANNRRYENGNKGGRKPKHDTTEPEVIETQPKSTEKEEEITKTEPKANQNETKPEANANKNYNDNVNDNDILLRKETKENFSFKKELLKNGFEENFVDEWIKVRKLKKAANTETALKAFLTEIQKTTIDKNEILKTCIVKSWSGFKVGWITQSDFNNKKFLNGNSTNGKHANYGKAAGTVSALQSLANDLEGFDPG